MRRLHSHRRRELIGQPALGGQHADHQRRVQVPAADRHRDQPQAAPGPGSASSPGPASPTTRSPASWPRPSTRPPTALPLRTRSRWSRRPRAADPVGDWDQPPAATEIGVFARFARELGGAFDTAASGGRKLYGFAEHQLTSTYLGTSTGLRLRHDQPTGRLELNAKSADMTKSAWAGAGTRTSRRRRQLTGGWPGPAARLGGPVGGAAGRPVRDAIAAYRPGRPDDLHVLVGRRQGRPRRPDGVQQAGRRHQDRRAPGHPAAVAAQRPGGCRPAVRALRHRACLQPGFISVRQRTAESHGPTGSPGATLPR